MYLAGYAVECRLKVALMRKYDCRTLKELAAALEGKGVVTTANEIYTHSLEKLLNLTGRAAALQSNAEVVKRFAVVNRWIPAWRYNPDRSGPDDADEFLEAVGVVAHWIDANI